MDTELVQIFEMMIALAAAIVAYWQNRQKNRAEGETRQVVAFFDPNDETVTALPEVVPARSWKMGDETRRWVLSGHDALTQASLLRQVEEAEKKCLTHYYLTFQDRGGGYYEIEYGLVKGSGIGKPEK